MNLKIDPEFRSIIPPLTQEEYSMLEESIKKGYNAAYPIIVCEGTIIDGHNRYELCKKYNIEFTTSEMSFNSELDIRIWIIKNQFSRRNLTPGNRCELALVLEPMIREKGKENLKETIAEARKSNPKTEEFLVCQNSDKLEIDRDFEKTYTLEDIVKEREKIERSFQRQEDKEQAIRDKEYFKPIDTKRELAKLAGVSHDTVMRYKKIKEKSPEETIKKVKSGEMSINQAYKEVKREEKKEELKAIQKVDKISPKPGLLTCISGTWYQLGDHLLYCGSNEDELFLNELKKHPASFAFADPPYNMGVAEWDNNFAWTQDWLIEYAPIVAVTPGINAIHTFMNITKMPYKWSVACWIDNGMTHGAMGFGNWIYVSLFSRGGVHCKSQDFLRVTINNSETEETEHKGRKPSPLIMWLLERYSRTSDYIIDPFLGSGTSLLVAEKMNRKCIGAEKELDFCTQIISRWEQLTTRKAIAYEN